MTARFSIVPADAFMDQRLTPADVRVLGVLGMFLDKSHKCWPTQGLLAERSGLNRGTVNRALKKLCALDYVRAKPRREGMRSSLVYQVFMDGSVRLEAQQEQPDLFPPPKPGEAKSSTTADVANFDMNEGEGRNPQQRQMLENATTETAVVASRGHNRCDVGGHTEGPNLTTQEDSSVPKGTDARSKKAEDDETDIVIAPTSGDLKRQLAFGTGKLLLTGQGLSASNAGAFLGKLVKDFGLDSVAAAVARAANDPPGDARGWLRQAAAAEARKRGVKVDGPAHDPDDAEAQRVAALDRRMGYLAKGQSWQPGWGPDPRLQDERVPAELYQKHGISRPAAYGRNA